MGELRKREKGEKVELVMMALYRFSLLLSRSVAGTRAASATQKACRRGVSGNSL